MKPRNFTRLPQYQSTDQRNYDIDYIRRPEPIVVHQVIPLEAPVPVAAPDATFGWHHLFARILFDKIEKEYITCRTVNYYRNAIPIS